MPLLQACGGATATTSGSARRRRTLNDVIKTVDQVYGGSAAIADWRKAEKFKFAAFAEGKAGLETNGNWIAWDIGQQKSPIPFTIAGIPGGSNNGGKQYIPSSAR
jgi:hypothetical protein